MLNLNDKNWHEFFLKDIFPIVQRGKRLTKANQYNGSKPYVSSTASNNGVDRFIGNEKGVRSFSNCLTIANSGSVGASFYQPFKFIASDHVTHLQNNQFNSSIYLFIGAQTNRFSEKYNFNREINDRRISREKVILPICDNGHPDLEFAELYTKTLIANKSIEYLKHCQKELSRLQYKNIKPIKDIQWDEFFIEDIAEVKPGKRLTKADMIKGNKPFIGSTDSNNGITNFVSNSNISEDINVLGVNYNGSVVENFYHPYTAIFSDDVKRLSFKNVEGSKHLFLFLKNAILKQKSKYQYAYKFNEKRLKRQKIMLPVKDSGEPDYDYMQQYMINFDYKKRKSFLDFKTSKTAVN